MQACQKAITWTVPTLAQRITHMGAGENRGMPCQASAHRSHQAREAKRGRQKSFCKTLQTSACQMQVYEDVREMRRTVLHRDAHKAGASAEEDGLAALLHVEALTHAAGAHQRRVTLTKHPPHLRRAGWTAPPPPPQVPHHRAVEALPHMCNFLGCMCNKRTPLKC